MKVIQTETSDQQIVFIQVIDEPDIVNMEQGDGSAAGVADAARILAKLDQVGDSIGQMCRTLHARIKESIQENKPKELSLEFGVTLAGEAGIPLVTNGSVEATFKVTAIWEFAK
jgi:Trypsin-co-occurring domain 1